MKFSKNLLAFIGLILCTSVSAQSLVSGTWEGELALGADTILTVQFIVETSEDGSRSVIIHSPDNGAIKNVPASSVDITAEAVVFTFASLSGEYSGVVENNILTGEWHQLDSSFPLLMTLREDLTLTADDIALLQGRWLGQIETPSGELPLQVRFETTEDGELVAFYHDPRFLGAAVDAAGMHISEIEFDRSTLSFNIPSIGVHYEGQLNDAGIEGVYHRGRGEGQELVLRKEDASQ